MNLTLLFSLSNKASALPPDGVKLTLGCTYWTVPPLEKLSDRELTSAALNPKHTIQMHGTCGPPFRDFCPSVLIYVYMFLSCTWKLLGQGCPDVKSVAHSIRWLKAFSILYALRKAFLEQHRQERNFCLFY